nr:hypothetical protein GTC16762_05880 [Pigmentibacter ruber]
MNKLTLTILSIGTIFSANMSSANTCTVYEHTQSGYSETYPAGTVSNNLSTHIIERESWNGHVQNWFGNGWRGQNRSFDNAISSVVLGPHCAIKLYTDAYFKGHWNILSNHTDGYQLRHLDEVRMNESVSSLVCECGLTDEMIKSNYYYRGIYGGCNKAYPSNCDY